MSLIRLHSPIEQKVDDGEREGSTVREVHQVIEGIESRTVEVVVASAFSRSPDS